MLLLKESKSQCFTKLKIAGLSLIARDPYSNLLGEIKGNIYDINVLIYEIDLLTFGCGTADAVSLASVLNTWYYKI